MTGNLRYILTAIGLLVLALIPLFAWQTEDTHLLFVVCRVMIFGIAALSLGLILGYGGMISFGHAAYLGIGAYTVGILGYYGVHSGFIQWPLAIVLSSAFAAAIGYICLRTTGLYFIMITLAFTQMLFFLFVSLTEYGGEDGMTIWQRSDFAGVVDLGDRYQLYYVILAILVGFTYISHRLVNSRFGMVIRGAMSNTARMEAIGFSVFRYKLAAFTIAGAMCGVAGVLLANLTDFVNPGYMHWTRSGELMFMVILGGMGTLIGPILGAAVFLYLEEVLAAQTEHWPLFLGLILVLVVLVAKRGIYGWLMPRRDGAATGTKE